MQVSSLNEVKIYSLSCGKSLPEWLSDRKKRALQKKDVDVRRRIELIQDFEMPTVCTTIKVSKDGQYILATGTYKPRVRCYDTYQLSLKFERCLDSEVVTFETLSDDYSKIVFLHNDRYVEFHSQSGFYYKTRIPKFGRDFSYHYPSCDLYFVGASSEVYRLNLEQGRYLNPLQTDAAENNVCDINSVHGLFATGTIEGRVECWDPRTRGRVGVLDCALSSVTADSEINSLPTISALKFNGALTMAVGTSTGQVLLYDLRSDKPLLVKDHQYGLPIKSVHFQDSLDLILSADSRIIKMWNKNSGKIFTSLEPEHDLNDVCLYPGSGMLLTANEAPKMGIYYIPVLGPAPRWCSFLDNLTEELEENPESTVYDDYKFVTKKDLENLGLTHLIGSPFLRAYMHGFFMDIRLYHKVKLMVNPFAYEEYRKDKIRQKIEETRAQRVQLKKLPKVNKELALKLIEEEEEKQKSTWKKKVKSLPNILTDDRFKVMFENPDFQVDEESEEFRLLNPLVSKISEKRKKKLRLLEQQELHGKEEEEEPEGKPSDAESSESSDDEKDWVAEVRKQRRLLQQEEKVKRQEQLREDQQTVLKPQFYEIKAGEEFRSFKDSATKQKLMNKTLEDRLKLEAKNGTLSVSDTTVGSKQLTFTLKKGACSFPRVSEFFIHKGASACSLPRARDTQNRQTWPWVSQSRGWREITYSHLIVSRSSRRSSRRLRNCTGRRGRLCAVRQAISGPGPGGGGHSTDSGAGPACDPEELSASPLPDRRSFVHVSHSRVWAALKSLGTLAFAERSPDRAVVPRPLVRLWGWARWPCGAPGHLCAVWLPENIIPSPWF